MKLNLRKPLVFFDLESTGLNLSHDRIVELCFIKILVNGEKQTMTKRINPGIPIPKEVSLLHGIYDEDVKDAPKFHEIAKSLATFIEGCDLSGFNMLKFDLPMLAEEFLRANIDFSVQGRNLIDAQKIFHMMEPRNLAAAYKFYCGKKLENAHSAEADTIATLEVLQAQIEKYEGNSLIDENTGKALFSISNDMAALHKLTENKNIDFAGRFVYNDKGEAVFNFGKHKDKTIGQVLQAEHQYYDWFMKSDFSLDSKRRFTELKIKHELAKK
ncbi:MAG: 3'-5' exonuclease [Bacteroidota bacterium]|nr:3'-5' exonuclease [Bacteroidota bacterium]